MTLQRVPISVQWPCLLLVLALTGCGSRTEVTGVVKYKGLPLTRGEIHFIGATGEPRSAPLASDGRYKVENPPTGPVKVTLVSEEVSQPAGGNGASFAAPPKVVKAPRRTSLIPARYGDRSKSPLTYTVTRGRQSFNIDLTD